MRRIFLSCLFVIFAFNISAYSEEERVKLPLSIWEKMINIIESNEMIDPAIFRYCPIERSITGTFQKGLFKGKLNTRFEVFDDTGHIRVPLLDGEASLGRVLLNGKETSLLSENGMFTIGIDKPGYYNVQVEFLWGMEQDRFDRRLKFRLPEAGVTRISITIPENNIESRMTNGAFISQENSAIGTQLEGYLDATGFFDLSWNRRVTHTIKKKSRIETNLYTLFTVKEAIVTGLSVFNVQLLEGEIDRIDIKLPQNIEVINVIGDAVLQWQTDIRNGRKLTILFRYLVEEETSLQVYFQFPVNNNQEILMEMPLPHESSIHTGAAGIQGAAGLNIQLADTKSANKLELRDYPPNLTQLTTSPLIYGFSFTDVPEIKINITRNKEVELVSTLADDMEAATVVIEDGLEITKMKLRIRNNTRQYLKMIFPKGARLTHSLIDGRPVRPAVIKSEKSEELLFPLQQSENIRDKDYQFHIVHAGETLTSIAQTYYSDPNKWKLILQANPDKLRNAYNIYAGQQLKIPFQKEVTVKEKSFLIELAYKKNEKNSLGFFGRYELQLPKIDIDTMELTWHLYFPKKYQVLDFSTNLTQLTNIRYDWFRRVRDFLFRALYTDAWAGESGKRYENILDQRKQIYKSGYADKVKASTVLANFPLVGELYRFKRNLLGQEVPEINTVYLSSWVSYPVKWLSLLASFILATYVLMDLKNRKHWIIAGVGLVILLFLAYNILGIHKRIIWGIDLAFIVSIYKARHKDYSQILSGIIKTPVDLKELFIFKNLLFLIGICLLLWFILSFPLLLSTTVMIILFIWWKKTANSAIQESSHA